MKALNTYSNTAFPDLIDYAIVDQNNDSIGTLHSMWMDEQTGQLEFLGVKTGWLFGSNHVVPAEKAQIDEANHTIMVPYALDLIKNAPAIDAEAEITDAQEAEIYRYYNLRRAGATTTAAHSTAAGAGLAAAATATPPPLPTNRATAAATTGRTGENLDVTLSEEQLKVGKRTVETGGMRLRKIVRTEQVQVPVELRREDVVIERIAAKDMRPGDVSAANFDAKNIDITLHREEAVVSKEAHVTGAVRVRKTSETETQTVSDTVRKEDIEVDKGGVRTAATDVRGDEGQNRR